MRKVNMQELKEKIKAELLNSNEKEFYCHVQFVTKIGKQLARDLKADATVVELSCLLHDIGRGREQSGESHEQTSLRIAKQILMNSSLSEIKVNQILRCVENHNYKITPVSIEEKIVISADSGSKVEYHEAFTLLCKKEGYKERAQWNFKYLEKGYKRILITEYKKKLRTKYYKLKAIYTDILS